MKLWVFLLLLVGDWAGAHQIIARLKPGQTLRAVESIQGLDGVEGRKLSSDLNLYLLEVQTNLSKRSALNQIRKSTSVMYAQLNHKIQFRSLPADPLFPKQWSLNSRAYANIEIDRAWAITKGGMGRDGAQPVIAIVDGGFDLEHPDLIDNFWRNQGERPGNGIDDDGNGYVDDVNGWSARNHSGVIDEDDHGTHVSGIAGAKCENATGICGLNWVTPVMTVAIGNGETSDVMEAYGYVLKQKKEFLLSQGMRGANVVVTNSSFGLDGADCMSGEYPAWNDMYEELGKVGILSAVASPNQDWDIDVKGDVPSACPSDYLISVTNIEQVGEIAMAKNSKGQPIKDSKGRIVREAAWGKKTVDLGAPGTDIMSTVVKEWDFDTGKWVKYAEYSGTSMATPHVAGTVSLMFSSASEKFHEEYLRDPAVAALRLRDLLLGTVVQEPFLQKMVVTGGRLSAGRAAEAAAQY